jgi:hypothetical protein
MNKLRIFKFGKIINESILIDRAFLLQILASVKTFE